MATTTPRSPPDLSAPYNDYAEKHLISTSEMKEPSRRRLHNAESNHIGARRRSRIRVQYRKRYLRTPTSPPSSFSNEEHPLKIDHDDRRLHVVSNFSIEKRVPEYYANRSAIRQLGDD